MDGVVTQAAILKQQIIDTIETEKEQLVVLHGHDREIEGNLDSLKDAISSNAIGFRNQLIADQLVLHVEIRDIEFGIVKVEEFLDKNF